jgi:hypothetical protein
MFVEDKPLTLPRTHPTQPRTAEDALLAAARLIEERGWSATGHRHYNHGPMCPVEAICEVTRDEQIRDEACRLLRDRIGGWRVGILRWNSLSTEEEVIATMRAAANAPKQEGK